MPKEVWFAAAAHILMSILLLASTILSFAWHRRWGSTPRILEASPEGLTAISARFWGLHRRLISKERIERLELVRLSKNRFSRKTHIVTLVARLKKWWSWPRQWQFRVHDVSQAERARDALANSLGLP
jgi:hypothetical protein